MTRKGVTPHLISLENEQREYEITVSMVHYKFKDKFIKPSTNEKIMEIIIGKLLKGEIDSYFTITKQEV